MIEQTEKQTIFINLNEDIKTGNFRPVYLLYGEEAYLKKQYKDKLTKAIFPDGDKKEVYVKLPFYIFIKLYSFYVYRIFCFKI